MGLSLLRPQTVAYGRVIDKIWTNEQLDRRSKAVIRRHTICFACRSASSSRSQVYCLNHGLKVLQRVCSCGKEGSYRSDVRDSPCPCSGARFHGICSPQAPPSGFVDTRHLGSACRRAGRSQEQGATNGNFPRAPEASLAASLASLNPVPAVCTSPPVNVDPAKKDRKAGGHSPSDVA